MLITKTWGDIVVDFLILFSGTAFITIFVKQIWPRLTDYWVAFSGRRAQDQIARIQERITKYENDFSDVKTFFCRIMNKLILLLLFGFAGIFLIAYGSYWGIAMTLGCIVQHGCDTANVHNNLPYNFLVILGWWVFAPLVATMAGTIRLELSPEKYRAQLKKRISRLQRKTAASTASIR